MTRNGNQIVIHGARVHNLKNISLTIPRDKLVVITGLSGSGKSSLAFDTIYAEGQRRYIESLSSYARQFLGMMDKPDVDQIDGLSPAISIDQRSTSHNPRSTVGTVTEIYDYLRLLYARVGIPHCPGCGREVSRQTIDQIVKRLNTLPAGTPLSLLSPVVRDQKGEHKGTIAELKKAGYVRLRFDNNFMSIEEAEDLRVDKQKKHSVEVVVDNVAVSADNDDISRLADSLETALELGDGIIKVWRQDTSEEMLFSQHFSCPHCQIDLPNIEPRSFSFNSPYGACAACTGLGTKLEIDPDLIIPNKRLSIAEGAIRPWSRTAVNQTWYYRIVEAVARASNFSLTVPVQKLSASDLKIILYGTGNQTYNVNAGADQNGKAREFYTAFEGVIPNLERRYRETESDYIRAEIERYMRIWPCPVCRGRRLKAEVLGVTVNKINISELTKMSITEALGFFLNLGGKGILTERNYKIARQIIKEIKERLSFLFDVGLDYLTLDRPAATLAGGEAQRIRLATQIGSSLMGVIYILDEPSIGLHQRDNAKLIATLRRLRDLGNTVIVVEHDYETMMAADQLIDIGPGAGKHGGEVVAQGTPQEVAKVKQSLTGQYLAGKLMISTPVKYRLGNGHKLSIKGAAEFNLKNIDVDIPLSKLVCITGVSGSGKSTLMTEILSKALAQHFFNAKDIPGKHKAITGLENIDKVISIDQSPIGRTPRSNPATYTGVFTYVRDLFAQLPEAKIRGYEPGRFSFNVKGGRCEACEGDGLVRIEMHFLPDVYVECEECHGKRYNQPALEIHYKGKNIADILEMTAEEAMNFFSNVPIIHDKLKVLCEVGLGYIHLGQSATTLSGGEAQRIKLSTELSRRSTGRTLYILDEPTTGLHFEDVRKLLQVLNELVDRGNTVLVIEHNLDVIKSADWVIDLGPEGGDKGGEVVATGTPRDVVKVKTSYTGQWLKKVL
ncbi:MAG: excinuclease ABC subunit UvrA [Patescibacteria group bacterium]